MSWTHSYATKKDLIKMLVANKIDKVSEKKSSSVVILFVYRTVTRSERLQFARRNSMLFIEAR